jgi:hypothetical protein
MDGMSLTTTIFGLPLTSTAGSMFVRVYPWAGAGAKSGKFTTVVLLGEFWLYFDASQSCWVAEVAGLAMPFLCETKIQDSNLQTVCLSWYPAASKPKIELCVAGVKHPVVLPLSGPLEFMPSGYPTVGSLCGVNYFWNGHIYFCDSNDRPVGEKSWKKYQSQRDLAPNPHDADRVSKVIAG